MTGKTQVGQGVSGILEKKSLFFNALMQQRFACETSERPQGFTDGNQSAAKPMGQEA